MERSWICVVPMFLYEVDDANGAGLSSGTYIYLLRCLMGVPEGHGLIRLAVKEESVEQGAPVSMGVDGYWSKGDIGVKEVLDDVSSHG